MPYSDIHFDDKIKQRGWAKTSKAVNPRRRAVTSASSVGVHSDSKRKIYKEPRVKEQKHPRTRKKIYLNIRRELCSKKQRNNC